MPTRAKPKTDAPDPDTTIVEGESSVVGETAIVPVPEPRHLTPVQGHLAVGVGALASMSDEAFDHNLEALKKGVERAARVKMAIMVENEDFGLIPGTKSPTLLKPGAEKLALAYGLVGRFAHHIRYGDGVIAPPIEVIVDSFIHLGDTAGPVVAQGMGAANSWEKRYRYRGAAGRTCPNCGADNVIRSNRDDGWWCGTRDGGCGTSFAAGDPRIADQEDPGKAENLDPFELLNTLLKMGEKRAYVDGILRATASSGLFTQDMEDDPYGSNRPQSPQNGSGAPTPARAAPRPAPAPAAPHGPSGSVQGPIESAPDGIRHVTPTSKEAVKYGVAGQQLDKLEVVFKSNNRKHTALLFGQLAIAADAAQLQAGEIVAVKGTVEEIVWQEGKPTKKEVWGVENVAVMRNGAWVEVASIAPTLPLEADPSPPSTAATAPDPTPPAAPAGTTPASPPASAAATPSTSAPTASDTSASADEAPPIPAAPAPPAAPVEPLDTSNGQSGAYALRLIRLNENKPAVRFGDTAGRKWGAFDAVHTSGETVKVVVPDDPVGDGQESGQVEALLGTQENPAFSEGVDLTVYGAWNGGWLVASAVGIRPL